MGHRRPSLRAIFLQISHKPMGACPRHFVESLIAIGLAVAEIIGDKQTNKQTSIFIYIDIYIYNAEAR